MKKRILVVDDEPDITWMIKLNLEQTGRYEVRTENLGRKAIEAALDPASPVRRRPRRARVRAGAALKTRVTGCRMALRLAFRHTARRLAIGQCSRLRHRRGTRRSG